eukprot:scaffold736_cov254-Pinguiococcus_pyrenoidosus.AAC.19
METAGFPSSRAEACTDAAVPSSAGTLAWIAQSLRSPASHFEHPPAEEKLRKRERPHLSGSEERTPGFPPSPPPRLSAGARLGVAGHSFAAGKVELRTFHGVMLERGLHLPSEAAKAL